MTVHREQSHFLHVSQYDCQFIPTFDCKWLHVHLLLSQFHQIQRSNSCFITIQQANSVKRHELKRSEHRQFRVLLWESINNQAKDTRAICHIRHKNGDSTNPDFAFKEADISHEWLELWSDRMNYCSGV